LLFQSNDGTRNLYFKKVGDNIAIDAVNIDDEMLHPLINFKALKGGRYRLHLAGDIDNTIHGKIIIDGGMVEKFQGYNNMLAFLNAIPALMTLSNPGFNDKGYQIKSGEIEYSIINQKLIKFKSIRIVGGSSTIIGVGEINLADNSVKIDLAVQTAREIGKVVGAIPIVGYILVGDGKSIAMGVTVRGSLDNPEVKSHALKDMVSLPLGMIERLLKSPARLIEGNKKANSNR
ncbi:MAG: AsmA-like C-terminal domain-containing protein, partial [Campylobacterales bacterium]|nr:AsmA-like C-terminal domain-containing protein [Campylobacterales bacterium]